MLRQLSLIATTFLAIHSTLAHPGHDIEKEAEEIRSFVKRNEPLKRSCESSLARRGHSAASIQRRSDLAQQARVKRSLAANRPLRRDFAEYNISHASTATFGDDELQLFADNSTCLLTPETTFGPYYVEGELIRRDVTEGQEGVPLYIDAQYIDVNTCEPVPAVFVEFWHANATGVYSGVIDPTNGAGENDTSNLAKTFLRGVQQTDANGVIQFDTIFPGHYARRATHIHLVSHLPNDTIVRTNGTLLGNESDFEIHASHVGQFFFDRKFPSSPCRSLAQLTSSTESLIAEVEKAAPYNTNNVEVTLNSVDFIANAVAETYDSFARYTLLGDSIEDGVLAWVTVVIDPSADYVTPARAVSHGAYAVANNDTYTCNATLCVVTGPEEPVPSLPQAESVEEWLSEE